MSLSDDRSNELTLSEIVYLSGELEEVCVKLRNLGISLAYLEKQGGIFAFVLQALLEANKVKSVAELQEPLMFAIGYIQTSAEAMKTEVVDTLNRQVKDEE